MVVKELRFKVADGVRFFNPDVIAQGIMRHEEPGSVVIVDGTKPSNVQFCRGECQAKNAKNEPHPQLIPLDKPTADAMGVPFVASEKKGA
jgi:hypothetical protein